MKHKIPSEWRIIEHHRLSLDKSRIPVQFHRIISIAETFGIHDVPHGYDVDIQRQILEEATIGELQAFYETMMPYMQMDSELSLLDWLTSDEAAKKPLSKEYIAFSYVVDNFDYVLFVIEQKQGKTG